MDMQINLIQFAVVDLLSLRIVLYIHYTVHFKGESPLVICLRIQIAGIWNVSSVIYQ